MNRIVAWFAEPAGRDWQTAVVLFLGALTLVALWAAVSLYAARRAKREDSDA